MAKLWVVDGDAVEGKDKHNVMGLAKPPPTPPPAYTGVGTYDYVGKMTDALSSFVTVDGKAAAVVTSKSSLNPGETAPGGKHAGPSGKDFLPPSPVPNELTLSITDTPLGQGVPNSGAGSTFVKIGGDKLLLDGDAIDTCDGAGGKANSKVTASGQSFVTCSE